MSQVWISVLSPDDLGAISPGSFQVAGEDFFGALVSRPEHVVAKLIGAPAVVWTAKQETLVKELREAPDDRARGAAKRRLPAFVPARFSGARRTIAECIGRQVIAHDFDAVEGTTFEAACETIRSRLPDRFLAIHTTATERNDDGSWRLRAFELLDRAATPEEWETRVKPHMRSSGADEQAIDVARLLYLPLRTAGYRHVVFDGTRTRLEDLQIDATKPLTAPVVVAPSVPLDDVTARRREGALALLGGAWPAKGRHAAQLALAGALRRDGWAREDALEFLCSVAARAGDEDRPKRIKTIDATWGAPITTGWTTLAKHVDVTIVEAARRLVDPDADAKRDLEGVAAQVPADVVPKDVTPPDQIAALEARYKITWGAWDGDVAPPTYLVQSIIPSNTVGMIVAKGSSLKTWMLLSIGIAVANGTPWLGTHLVEQGRVLMIDFEEGRDTLQRRAHLLGRAASPELGHANFPHARLDDVEFWKDVARIVQARSVRLVCIDSFAAGTPGVDENDRRAADPLAYAGRIAEELGVTILILHHGKKGDGGDERDQVRGNGALYAGLDWSYALIPQDENRQRMSVRCIKPCGPRPPDFCIALTEHGLVLDQAVDAREEDLKLRQKILKALERGPIATLRDLENELGVQRGSLKDHIASLVVQKRVRTIKGSGYNLDTPEARSQRIVSAVLGGRYTTAAQVADVAFVDAVDVEAEIRQGSICREYPSGPYMKVNSPR